MDCSPPGSSVHVILQARILECVATPFCRGSSWPRDQTHISCLGRLLLCCWAARDHFTNKNPRVWVSSWSHTSKKLSDCIPHRLSTWPCCSLQHSYTGLEIFTVLIMDWKFESVITKGNRLIALGSKEPGIHNPILTSVLTVCQTLIMSSSEASLYLFIK